MAVRIAASIAPRLAAYRPARLTAVRARSGGRGGGTGAGTASGRAAPVTGTASAVATSAASRLRRRRLPAGLG
ncbi:hypothetical protein GCM10027612_37070 [Microbispora bryophytorum subsp. camponoti]